MLPYRRAVLAVAAAYIASASAQEWGGGSQQYCSNQNTGSDYSAGASRVSELSRSEGIFANPAQ